MLITSSLSQMKNYKADEIYFIVRSPGKVNVKNMIHMPQLSPSLDLFFWFQKQKKSNLPWWDEYKRRFLHDMQTNAEMIQALDFIEISAKTKNVMLVCFCGSANECHRSIIADELERRGIQVAKH